MLNMSSILGNHFFGKKDSGYFQLFAGGFYLDQIPVCV